MPGEIQVISCNLRLWPHDVNNWLVLSKNQGQSHHDLALLRLYQITYGGLYLISDFVLSALNLNHCILELSLVYFLFVGFLFGLFCFVLVLISTSGLYLKPTKSESLEMESGHSSLLKVPW